MRSHAELKVGQIWRSSDPRRLRAFRVTEITDHHVICKNIQTGRIDEIRRAAFQATGTKGYVLVHDAVSA